MGTSIGLHPNYGETNQVYKFKARCGGYDHDKHSVYLHIDTGLSQDVAFHRVDVNDLLELQAVIAEATVKAQKILAPAQGCAGCGGPLDANDSCPACLSNVESMGVIDAAADAQATEDVERNIRLANTAEQLLLNCKHTLVPPISAAMGTVDNYLEWTEKQALALIRAVEPATPEDLEEARAFIAAGLRERAENATKILDLPDADSYQES